jgi:hypothetical protein
MTRTKSLFIGLTTLASLVALAPAAWAGCGENFVKQPATWQAPAISGENPLLIRVDASDAAIVGMWSVTFTAGGNVIDFGYAQWHSDGTEFLNSGGRAPATQNYCLGVWARTGPSSFKLNHFALSYDPTGVLNGKVNIKEEVVVDQRGMNFSGPFTIDVYDPHTGALLQHVGGTVTGQRITAN